MNNKDEIEDLKLLYRSKIKGEIEEHEYDEIKKILKIYVNNSTDIYLSSIKLSGKTYTIKKLDDTNIAETSKLQLMKVEVKSIDYEMFKNLLPLYLEKLIGHQDYKFEKQDYGIQFLNFDDSLIIIVSAKCIDFTKVAMKHKEQPKLKDCDVYWEKLADSKTLLVTSSESQEFLELYLQNETRSGGGEIKKIVKIDNPNKDVNIFLIEYTDDLRVEKVLEKIHQDMKIRLIHDDIETFQLKLQRAKKNFKVLNAKEFPFSLIVMLTMHLEYFKTDLLKLTNNCAIVKESDDERIKIEYWPIKISERDLDTHINSLKRKFDSEEWNIKKDIDVIKLIKNNLETCYKNSRISNLILTLVNQESLKIRIECTDEQLHNEKLKIEEIINNEKNQKMLATVKLEGYRCRLLLKNGFILECRNAYSDIKITINSRSETITYEGFSSSVLFSKQ